MKLGKAMTLACAASAEVFAGCLPIPWSYHRTPDIYGVLTSRGVVVAQAKVRYSIDSTAVGCNPATDEAMSSKDGEFYLDGTRSFFHLVWIVPGPADYFVQYRVCFETTDGQHFEKSLAVTWGWPIGSYPSNSPALVSTNCDLSDRACDAFPLPSR